MQVLYILGSDTLTIEVESTSPNAKGEKKKSRSLEIFEAYTCPIPWARQGKDKIPSSDFATYRFKARSEK